ncbi:MAG: hypothetical protein H0A75_03000 [Candidatus Methanofishera endochildressiae]|uniref:Uncharacterized protein n=1 Tax=Candidatus Methanofishera endochildressiae TaxID=2738884 RepID=A0A7Z0MN59_9GAMM|nr:hypothetical protein [Candidatus Methanofishera endochildressiae]
MGYLVILQGSTETTFYVLAVYFGSAQVRQIRHALAAGLRVICGYYCGYCGLLFFMLRVCYTLSHSVWARITHPTGGCNYG